MDDGLQLSLLQRVDTVKIIRNDDGTYAVKDSGQVYFRDKVDDYTRIQGKFEMLSDAIKFARSLKHDSNIEAQAIQFIESRKDDEQSTVSTRITK